MTNFEWQTWLDLTAAHNLILQRDWKKSIYNQIAASVPGAATSMLVRRNRIQYSEAPASNLARADITRILDGTARERVSEMPTGVCDSRLMTKAAA